MFDKAFDDLMKLEGGYTEGTHDNAGPTMYGITNFTAKSNGYVGQMKDLPLEFAKEIYKKCYWDKMQLDEVAKLSYDIAWQLFQCGVNQGIMVAVGALQRGLNCLELPTYLRSPTLPSYLNQDLLIVDGIMGHKTYFLFQSIMLAIKDKGAMESTILSMLKAQQIMRYMGLVEHTPSNAIFLNGWINRVGL